MQGLYNKEVLSNGAVVITEEIPYVRSVAIGFWVKTGSRCETDVQQGMSHFIEHLLFKGTRKYSAADIANKIDSMGGCVDAFTSHEYTCFYARVLDEQLEAALEFLTDLIAYPKFDFHELELERQVIFEEIKTSEDTPDDHISVLLTNTLWPDHPLGKPILGTKDSVAGLGRSQIVDFFNDCYRPSNIIISAAGNIKHGHFIKLLERFYNLPALNCLKLPRQSLPKFNSCTLSVNKELEQVHLCLGTKGLSHTDQSRYGIEMLNVILGGSNSSRLFQEIREIRGLAYSVYSEFVSYHDTGMGLIYAGTSKPSYMEVIELILKQLKRLKEVEVSNEELIRGKNHLKAQVTLGRENTFNRMNAQARDEIYFGRLVSLDEVLSGIDRVSIRQINDLANELFDHKSLALIAMGAVGGESLPSNILYC